MKELCIEEQRLLSELLETKDRDRQSKIKKQITRINKKMESLDR